MKILLLTALILFNLPAHGVVNTRNGAFSDSWIDYLDPGAGIEMKIKRFYSSRSLFIGLFGFGWCSDLETRLNITSDGIVNLRECGGGLEVTYYPNDFDLVSPKDTIDKIVKDYQTSKKLRSNDIKNLKAQLKANTKMRFEYANKLGLVNIRKIKTKGNTYLSKSRGFEKIVFDGNFYERRKIDGTVQRFNREGYLVKFTNSKGKWIKIRRDGKIIRSISDEKRRQLYFQYNKSTRKLSRIHNGGDLNVVYTFSGEDLVQVKNMWSKTYKFNYDEFHNLIGVEFPDSSKIQMRYDVARDWITWYKNRIDCEETFRFDLGKDNSPDYYIGSFTKQCPKEKFIKGSHEFWYGTYSFSKDKYLGKVREKLNDYQKNIKFHRYIGKPESIEDNDSDRVFVYYLNGLISRYNHKEYDRFRKVIKWFKIAFNYDRKSVKVNKTVRQNLSSKGKIQGSETVSYSYKGGLLAKASKTNGEFVNLDYDDNGRIKTLRNHKKQKVTLTYKLGQAKPTEISQESLGKVRIKYDSSGEVESVEAVNERDVASSVVESFLGMVEFLGPMGENLKL